MTYPGTDASRQGTLSLPEPPQSDAGRPAPTTNKHPNPPKRCTLETGEPMPPHSSSATRASRPGKSRLLLDQTALSDARPGARIRRSRLLESEAARGRDNPRPLAKFNNPTTGLGASRILQRSLHHWMYFCEPRKAWVGRAVGMRPARPRVSGRPGPPVTNAMSVPLRRHTPRTYLIRLARRRTSRLVAWHFAPPIFPTGMELLGTARATLAIVATRGTMPRQTVSALHRGLQVVGAQYPGNTRRFRTSHPWTDDLNTPATKDTAKRDSGPPRR